MAQVNRCLYEESFDIFTVKFQRNEKRYRKIINLNVDDDLKKNSPQKFVKEKFTECCLNPWEVTIIYVWLCFWWWSLLDLISYKKKFDPDLFVTVTIKTNLLLKKEFVSTYVVRYNTKHNLLNMTHDLLHFNKHSLVVTHL